MSYIGVSLAVSNSRPIFSGSGVSGGLEFGWQTGITGHPVSTTDFENDTMTATPGNSWGTVGLVNYPITAGKVSIDVKILAVASPARLGVGISRTSNISSFSPNAIYASTDTSQCRGAEVATAVVNDIITIEMDYSTGDFVVKKNNVQVGSTLSVTVGGNTWYFAFDEYEDSPKWQLVPQVYAPSSGFTKINP